MTLSAMSTFRAYYTPAAVPAPAACATAGVVLPESKHERRYCSPACKQKVCRRRQGSYTGASLVVQAGLVVLTPEEQAEIAAEIAAEDAEAEAIAKAEALAADIAAGARSVQFDTYSRFPEVQDHLPSRY